MHIAKLCVHSQEHLPPTHPILIYPRDNSQYINSSTRPAHLRVMEELIFGVIFLEVEVGVGVGWPHGAVGSQHILMIFHRSLWNHTIAPVRNPAIVNTLDGLNVRSVLEVFLKLFLSFIESGRINLTSSLLRQHNFALNIFDTCRILHFKRPTLSWRNKRECIGSHTNNLRYK